MCKNTGWIKIYRDFRESCIRHGYNANTVAVMMWLLLGATWRDDEVEGWGKLQPGQLKISFRQIGEELKLNHGMVRRIVIRLEDDGFLKIQNNPKWGTLITINNFVDYQTGSEPTKHETLNETLNETLDETLKTDNQTIENKEVLVFQNNQHETLNETLDETLNETPRARVLSSDSKEYLKNLKEKNTVVEVRTADAQPPPSDDFKLSNDIPESRRKKPVQPITFDYDGDMNFHGEQLPHFVEVWKQSFPAIDVVKEIGKARAWLSALSVQKRKKDIKAFLSRWLGKAQEQYDRQISMQGGGRMSPAEYAREKKLARDQEAGLVVSKDYSSVKMPDWLVAQIREANDKKKTQTGGNNDAKKE